MGKHIAWPDAIERRHFPGFPGIYGPGESVPLSSTGLTEAEATKRIAEGNLPLVITSDRDSPPPSKGGKRKGGDH